MTSPTPDLAELLELPWRVWPPEERAARPADTYDVLVVSGSEVRVNLTFAAASSIVAAVNALPALLDAAAERDQLREAVRSYGRTIDRWGKLIIAATHSEDITTPDGDGDWHVIEERLDEVPAILAERDALAAKVEAVRALHYAAENDAARTPICETCHGKAGVHECGCWAERDREPVCGHCMDGWHGASVPWPCPTICALDGEADR